MGSQTSRADNIFKHDFLSSITVTIVIIIIVVSRGM